MIKNGLKVKLAGKPNVWKEKLLRLNETLSQKQQKLFLGLSAKQTPLIITRCFL